MDFTDQNIPNPLKARRIAKGWTQSQLARAIGRHPNTIGVAERSGFVSTDMAKRAAAALGCRVEDLLAGGRP